MSKKQPFLIGFSMIDYRLSSTISIDVQENLLYQIVRFAT